MTQLVEVPCEECKTLFLPGRITQRFCSKPCKIRWSARDWRLRNPDRAKELDTQNRERHRDAINARVRKWHTAHRDEQNAKRRDHHAENRTGANARRQQWYENHREYSMQETRKNYRQARIVAPWSLLLHSAKCRAAAKKVPFCLTNEWAETAWTGKCAISGVAFDLGTGNRWSRMRSPSIDRIRPEIGYTPENSRFILWCINAFKGTGTDEEMFEVVGAMVMSL